MSANISFCDSGVWEAARTSFTYWPSAYTNRLDIIVRPKELAQGTIRRREVVVMK